MRKHWRIALALSILTGASSYAQEHATDWSSMDCKGVSHSLFAELNQGKIIIVAWVMPCGSCVGGVTAAYEALSSLERTHPGKVVCYLVDDEGNSDCKELADWFTTRNIGDIAQLTLFSNEGNTIKEEDYGGSGMPHIVVLGGSDHRIFFNEKFTKANDPGGIENAANEALQASTDIMDPTRAVVFKIAPNPIKDQIFLDAGTTLLEQVTITDITGRVMVRQVYSMGRASLSLDCSSLLPGMYRIEVMDKRGKVGTQKMVKQ